MNPFSLSFEPPRHGWLPVRVEGADQVIEFDASDVPNNPVADLCEALFLVTRGQAAAVLWHLEPDGYYLYLEPGARATAVRLTFAQNSVRAAEEPVLSITAPTNHVLLTLWRFLRRFETAAFTEPDWPPVNFTGLDALGQRIKAGA
jgi:hypothetical protein